MSQEDFDGEFDGLDCPGTRATWKPTDQYGKAYLQCIKLIVEGEILKAQTIAKELPGELGRMGLEVTGLVQKVLNYIDNGKLMEARDLTRECLIGRIATMLKKRLAAVGMDVHIDIDDAEAREAKSQSKNRTASRAPLRQIQKENGAVLPSKLEAPSVSPPSLRERIEQILRKRLENSPSFQEKEYSNYVEKIVEIGTMLGWEEHLRQSPNYALPCSHVALSLIFIFLRARARNTSSLHLQTLAKVIGCAEGSVRTTLAQIRSYLQEAGCGFHAYKDMVTIFAA